ncbi:MAG: PstS family phosphate ABC transporter substrate-binding protein [Pseudomonadota bacterium]|nr:PstS family phosphate ABC transporter substrate-binding protein [Pseudomonadota bacterium]
MSHLSRSPLLPILSSLLLAACGGGDESAQRDDGTGTGAEMTGVVSLDGSSTVYPISEAVAEEFPANVAPRVRVTVGVSGTGGGFKKFLAGEIDINDASRPISESEIEAARANGIDYLEIPVAYDGLSVVVNPNNTWVDHLTMAELQTIWQPGSTVDSWNDIRAGWPDRPIRLYGAGTDSGTFDYFTETVNGETGASRPDYTASEDDNVLVTGIEGDENALGYFGYAYYQENQERLKLVPIDGGNGPIAPDPTTINNGTYSPLSRPVFIYVNKASLARPQVRAFVEFYLEIAPEIVSEVGYIPLPDADYQKSRDALAAF